MIWMLLSSILIFNSGPDTNEDDLLVMFWNLENFFDWKDQGTGESDKDFSSYGSRHWTSRKFYVKCDAVSKVIFNIAYKQGRLPDVIGFAEIENRGVLSKLIASTLLRKCDYRIVHFDSGDRRGIDVAFLYRESEFDLLTISRKVPEIDNLRIPTRDMLHIALKHKNRGMEVDFIVCHHPSKFGGEEESRIKRSAAMNALKEMCDSLKGCRIVAMGDFNDNPRAAQFDILKDVLINKADSLHMLRKGTIRYEGKWELIDMFLVSSSLSDASRMEIIELPFLMARESRHSGFKPFRTYSGPRYIGGVSDHLPIILNLDLRKIH